MGLERTQPFYWNATEGGYIYVVDAMIALCAGNGQ